jgi:hypothetical protein
MNIILRGVNRLLRFWGFSINRIHTHIPKAGHVFSIGIFEGNDPFTLLADTRVRNPVVTAEMITDVRAKFVADPFMIHIDNIWYMFFEVMNRRTNDGEIGLAVSKDLAQWTYESIVLKEPFHLSYPYVFSWKNDIYMIPETRETKTVRLYKAEGFPYRWKFVETLLSGADYTDSSIFQYAGKWWLFTQIDGDLRFNSLHVYYADDLFGPWREHPLNPVITDDPKVARPAGRVTLNNGSLIRYAQDCSDAYGLRVNAFNVKKLTTIEYIEEAYSGNPILAGSGTGWNKDGMHHIDAHEITSDRWVAAVDGWYWG